MTKQEFNQSDIQALFDDAEYLVDEAEALKYVIDSVPYDEVPPGDYNIYDKLRLIDHAQHHYFRPITEKMFSETRRIALSEYNHFRDTFEDSSQDEDDDKNVQKVLNKLIKHRAALLTIFKKLARIDWEKNLRDEKGRDITFYDFAATMIENERKLLKEIADLVLIFQNEHMHQREINKRAITRNNP